MKNILVAILMLFMAAALIYTVTLMPPMGTKSNPPNVNTIPRYLEHGAEEAGTENIVTGIVLNYRGYDTMGEVTVIFSALSSVIAVLTRGKRRLQSAQNSGSKTSPFIRTVTAFVLPFIILFSFYVILHGDTSPGGGFQGGAIIGAAMIIYSIVFSAGETIDGLSNRSLVPFEGTAVLTFFLTGILGVITGASFLTYILPGLAAGLQPVVRTLMLLILEIGIGAGGAIIFVSIFSAMVREE
jgi:multicomponent Na+:H+ antiporter subunit B